MFSSAVHSQVADIYIILSLFRFNLINLINIDLIFAPATPLECEPI
jgi:hypothetical protein